MDVNDVFVLEGVLSDEIVNKILSLEDQVEMEDALSESGKFHADMIDNYKTANYDEIYAASSPEEQKLMELELESLKEDMRKDPEIKRHVGYRSAKRGLINNNKNGWLSNILMTFATNANWAWMYDITGIFQMEILHYTRREEDHYDWHVDTQLIPDSLRSRKLTIIVQLSDGEDYEGCDLEIRESHAFHPDEINIFDHMPHDIRKKGTVIVFPSFQEHRITPLLSGERKSLVAWATGPAWK